VPGAAGPRVGIVHDANMPVNKAFKE